MRRAIYPDTRLTRKMNSLGWETVEEFCKYSDVTKVASRNTVRELIIHQKKIIEPIFIKIAQALKFTPNEIKQLLVEHGYTDFVDLIGDFKGEKLNESEKAFLSIYNKLKSRYPTVLPSIISFFESLCITSEIDCFDELRILRKKTKRTSSD